LVIGFAAFIDCRQNSPTAHQRKSMAALASSVSEKPAQERRLDMENSRPLTDAASEVHELAAEDFRAAIPFSALSASLRKKLGVRGPQKAPTKVTTTIRLDPGVLKALKATGRGWQTRADDLLRADIEAGRL
jgi:uncharacterized protein (DUF4415 family)